MKKILVSLLLVGVLALSGCGIFNDKPTQAEITTTAVEVLDAYQANQIKADQIYKGKLTSVTGVVDGTGVSKGISYLNLGTGDPHTIVPIQCFFKERSEVDKLEALEKGSTVTILGKIEGLGLTVTMKDCKLV